MKFGGGPEHLLYYFMTWRAACCNQEQVFWLEGSLSYAEWISAVYILRFLCHLARLGSDSLYCPLFSPHCEPWNVPSVEGLPINLLDS